ncbi:sporulation integral membrane protein YtvI [Acidaminobacter hydrogenoformans]|uniref:Sporulation integral membrane protein YtvI n=1 Tax=Acidaminobacter hydrogenoformans DSM 2784 TaxID=1120920 RepID=A0A1G5RT14_9FIRM|nr:sporulation integral membrane protein YtvI [Acidaminobacter hydrogenoformans]SCZ77252.1 sporulation integral membrane protein YtvI [Acidaminobacter hydrogenoformans DSM 2784]
MNSIVLSKLSLIALGLFFLFLFYTKLIPLLLIFLPFWLGYLLSRPLSKLVDRIKIWIKLPDALIVLVLMALTISLGGFLLFKLGVMGVVAFQDMLPEIPGWIDSLSSYNTRVLNVIEKVYLNLPQEYEGFLATAWSRMAEALATLLSEAAQSSFGMLKSLPRIVVSIFVILISTFFFTADRIRIQRQFKPWIQRWVHDNPYIQTFKQDVWRVATGYFKAQLTLMTITFSVSLVGLLILRVPNALPIAVGIGLVDVVPALGPAAVYVPWAVSKLILSDVSAAVQLLILYAVVTVTRQMLEPKIVGHHIGIHPLITLLSLYLGIRFLGFSGLILGPLTAITVIAYYKKFSKNQIDEH